MVTATVGISVLLQTFELRWTVAANYVFSIYIFAKASILGYYFITVAILSRLSSSFVSLFVQSKDKFQTDFEIYSDLAFSFF